jgi:HEAT repeat protein
VACVSRWSEKSGPPADCTPQAVLSQKSGAQAHSLSKRRKPMRRSVSTMSVILAALGLCMCVGTFIGATAACQTPKNPLEAEAARAVEQMRDMSMILQGTGRPTERELRRLEITRRLRDLGAAAIPALRQALIDPDVQMRRNAALVLINLGGGYSPEAQPPLDIRGALPSLIESTKDPDSHVRGWAAHAIAEMGPAGEPAIPALLILVRDPEEGPRTTSCLALGRIGPAASVALPAMRDALKDPSSDVRRFAQSAIDRIEKK